MPWSRVFRVYAHYTWKGNLVNMKKDILVNNVEDARGEFERDYRLSRSIGGYPKTIPQFSLVTIDKIEEIPWKKSTIFKEEQLEKRRPPEDDGRDDPAFKDIPWNEITADEVLQLEPLFTDEGKRKEFLDHANLTDPLLMLYGQCEGMLVFLPERFSFEDEDLDRIPQYVQEQIQKQKEKQERGVFCRYAYVFDEDSDDIRIVLSARKLSSLQNLSTYLRDIRSEPGND